MRNLALGSLFDGSGGFPLAGLLAGIVPVWSSEIEPFAIRVTEKLNRLSSVLLLGFRSVLVHLPRPFCVTLSESLSTGLCSLVRSVTVT